jgi:hypothetical protein
MRKETLRSTRSSSRARTDQRGFALIAAISLSVLYFMLIELMLIDSSRELAEARRFRARIVATTLAENGAELAAAQLVTRAAATVQGGDWQGTMSGRMTRTGNQFDITAEGETRGHDRAAVVLRGRVNGTAISIDYAIHTP